MRLVAFLATLLLCAPAVAVAPGHAAAQSSKDGLGGVIDTLGGILGVSGGRMHGNVVMTKGDMLVFRTDAGRTLSVDASKTDSRVRGLLKPGDGVTVTLKQQKAGESKDTVASAAELQLDPQNQAGKSWMTVEGTVQESSKSRVTFKTREGFTLPLDTASITGLPPLTAGQPATLVYEQGRQGPVAVWIEPGTALGSTTSPPPSASPDTSVQRVHGLVDTVTMSGFTLKSDDGRQLTVDTQKLPQASVSNVRPGELVTVFGRQGTGANVITADFIQPDK